MVRWRCGGGAGGGVEAVRARCQGRHSSEVTVVRRVVRRCGDGAGAGHSRGGARAPLEEMSITLTTTPPL